jgi:hypothetical protein
MLLFRQEGHHLDAQRIRLHLAQAPLDLVLARCIETVRGDLVIVVAVPTLEVVMERSPEAPDMTLRVIT